MPRKRKLKSDRVPMELPPPPVGDSSFSGRLRARARRLWITRQRDAGYLAKEIAYVLGVAPGTIYKLAADLRRG